jgi:hypothetical protein
MDKNVLIDELEKIIISNDNLLDDNLKNETFDDDFTPEEEIIIDTKNILLEVANKLDKRKIDINEFYKKMNINYLEIISQNIFVRNTITFQFTKDIIFQAVDLQYGIYDLYIDLIFSSTISWINYIEINYSR